MNLQQAYALHADISTMHNNVTRLALAAEYSDPAYQELNDIARSLFAASSRAYEMAERLYSERDTA